MIKAVIFDFDGTLADTIPAIREGVNLTMGELGYPTHDDAAILSFINFGPKHLIRCALPPMLQEDEEILESALRLFHQRYGEVYLHTERAYDGMRELVSRLHGDYKIGILSNKQDEFVKQLCAQVLDEGSYDATQGSLQNHPAKPHPYLSERIAAAMEVSADDCVLIGDSDVDVLAAKNAGMEHIGVSWGFRNEEFLRRHGATKIAHSPDELEQMIRGAF